MTAISAPVASSGPSAESSVHRHKFVRALDGRIDKVRVGFGYQLGLLATAVVMLILPLIYMALVAVVAYGVYWHAVYDTSIFEGRGNGRGKLIAYLAPLAVGIILVLFMVKPLFARRSRGNAPMALRRENEPLLFAFVDRLCEVVGARKPSRIQVNTQVNASASFREGIIGFIRKDLVLTIGLPLAAGLTIRQLAGVLAHEFGHFAQGTGMRLTFIVRSINHWFARVVYERDAWDEWLERASRDGGHWGITIIMLLSRLFVFLTRRVLWLLMMIGHAVSSFMMRQMEFDADRYETRVAGSEAFVATSERIRLLSVASHAAMSDLQAAWQERRLGDDLALLVRHRDVTMPAEVRRAVEKHAAETRTGWFDTHPCDAARIASSRRENAAGLFQLDDPATDLFADFCVLSRDATVNFYQRDLGLPIRSENLVSSSDLITTVGKQEEAQQSVGRYFQGLVHPVRPVFLPSTSVDVRDRDAAAELLLDRRGQAVSFGKQLAGDVKAFSDADKKLVNVRTARAKLSAGLHVDFAALEVPPGTYESLRAVEQSIAAERSAAVQRLNAALLPQMERLQVALALTAPVPATRPEPEHAAEEEDFGEYEISDAPAGVGANLGVDDALLTAFAGLARAAERVEELRQHWVVFAGLLPHLRQDKNAEAFINEVLARARKVSRSLGDVRDALHKIPYPYEHVERGVSLATFVVKAVPVENQVGVVYQAGEMAIDAYYPLYVRILSDLCSRAEAAEQEFGLEPLAEPQHESGTP